MDKYYYYYYFSKQLTEKLIELIMCARRLVSRSLCVAQDFQEYLSLRAAAHTYIVVLREIYKQEQNELERCVCWPM